MTSYRAVFDRIILIPTLAIISLLAGIFINAFLFENFLKLFSVQHAINISFLIPIPLMWVGIIILVRSATQIKKLSNNFPGSQKAPLTKFDFPLIYHYLVACFGVGMILFYQQMAMFLP